MPVSELGERENHLGITAVSDSEIKDIVTMRLCSTCETAEYAQNSAKVSVALMEIGLQGKVHVLPTECLGGCESPASLSLQGKDRASYVFSGIDYSIDCTDIATTCQLYLNAEGGWIEDARDCGRLRYCLRARIPALAD